MADSEMRSTSPAVSAALLRGRPRKATPNALTKQAATSAAASASMAPTAGTMIFSAHCGRSGLCSTAWKISHSETKPLNGGSAEMATQPISTTKLVCGIRWIRPPSLSMSRSPVEVSTAPAPKNSRLLKKRVVERMKQRGGEGERRRQLHAVGLKRQRQAEADEDDADVLDRAVGQQAL